MVSCLLFPLFMCRQDGNRSNLRNAAYEALGELIKNSPRVSPRLSYPTNKHHTAALFGAMPAVAKGSSSALPCHGQPAMMPVPHPEMDLYLLCVVGLL